MSGGHCRVLLIRGGPSRRACGGAAEVPGCAADSPEHDAAFLGHGARQAKCATGSLKSGGKPAASIVLWLMRGVPRTGHVASLARHIISTTEPVMDELDESLNSALERALSTKAAMELLAAEAYSWIWELVPLEDYSASIQSAFQQELVLSRSDTP